MAAAPPGPGGALLSVPAPPTLASLFADASLDPARGDWAAPMAAFKIDKDNVAANIPTDRLKNMVASSGALNQLLAYTTISGGRARLYTFMARWDDSIVAPNAMLDGKFFAIEGELVGHRGQGHVVQLEGTLFNNMGAVSVVPTVPTILAALAADATILEMGPYAAGDAGTEGVKSRKICSVPHSIAGLFVTQPDGVTWQHYFTVVYPVIVGEGKQAAYHPLTILFQQLTVGHLTASINSPRPGAPAYSRELATRYMGIIDKVFPSLAPGAAAHANTQIATALGALATQNQQHHEEKAAAKAAKETKTVSGWLGDLRMKTLLYLTGCRDEAELVAACPVYLRMAKAPKGDRLAFLQDAVDDNLAAQGNKHLAVQISYPVFVNFLAMDWGRVSAHTLKTGFFGNMFLWGETDIEATISINAQAATLLNSDRAPTLTDTNAVLKLDVNPPIGGKGLGNFLRMGAVCEVLLPAANDFRKHLAVHNANFAHFQDTWVSTKLEGAGRTEIKGVLYLQAMSLRFSTYWNDQKTSASRVDLKSPTELVERIMSTDETWVPNLSAALRTALNISALTRMAGGGASPASKTSAAGDDATVSTMGLTGMSINTADISAFRTLIREEVGSVGGDKGRGGGPKGKVNTQVSNTNYFGSLFGVFKDRKVKGKVVPCPVVRKAIKENELPQLPKSKASEDPMCLAWHVKGVCSSGCPRHGDHLLDYTIGKSRHMEAWCATNWPEEE